MVGISHLHPDHTSDLPALMWASNRVRSAPLPIVGPSGNNVAPDFKVFLARLFDEKTGAFQVLGSTLGAEQPGVERPRIEASVVDVSKTEPTKVFDRDGLTVTRAAHPARQSADARLPGRRPRVSVVVFSSDQNGSDPKFVDFAKSADVLVMHLAIAAERTAEPAACFAQRGRPRRAGGRRQAARSSATSASSISMPRLADVKKSYTGPLTVGADLQCTRVQ